MTEEHKLRISLSMKGKKNFLGHHHPEEVCAKISATEKGKSVSPETRAKMSKAMTGQSRPSGMMSKFWKGGRAGWKRKKRAKRRTLGFVPLNSPFLGCEGHHVNQDEVIHIPVALHKSIKHNIWTGKNMAQINAIAYNYLFKQEVEAAIATKEKL